MLIDSGIKAINEILRGGIRTGSIIDFYGKSGVGKSQLCFTICANLIKKYPSSIVFVDTIGTFRPERILQILSSDRKDLLKKIWLIRPTTAGEQVNTIKEIEKLKPQIVIIDNITDLFSTLSNSERHLLLRKYLHDLAYISIINNCSIIITNMVRSVSYQSEINSETFIDKEFMESSISIYTKCRFQISLLDKGLRLARLISPPTNDRFTFIITEKGIETNY